MAVTDDALQSAQSLMADAVRLQQSGDFDGAAGVLLQGVEQFHAINDADDVPWFAKEYLLLLLKMRHWDKAEALVVESGSPTGSLWQERLFARAHDEAGDTVNAARRWAHVIACEPRDREAVEWAVRHLGDMAHDHPDRFSIADTFQAVCAAWMQTDIEIAWQYYIEWAAILPNLRGRRSGNIFIRILFDRIVAAGDVRRLEALVDTQIAHLSGFTDYIENKLPRAPRFEDALRHFQYKLLDLSPDVDRLSDVARMAIGSVNADLAREAAFRLRQTIKATPKLKPSQKCDAYVLSADASLCAGDLDRAEEFYEAAERAQPTSYIAVLGSAAVKLDRGQLGPCAELLSKALSLAQDTDIFLLKNLIASRLEQISGRDAQPTNSSMDLVIFSHATEKMKQHQHLAPPRTDMIATILRDAPSRAPADGSFTSTIMYDHRESDLSAEYLANLKVLAQEKNASLVVNMRNGLRRQWIDGLDRVGSEFILIIEQDFVLLPNCPGWAAVIDLMHRRPDISYVRFNKRRTIRKSFERAAYQTLRDVKDGITRTTFHSNTPHVMRRRLYTDILRPIIVGRDGFDGQNAGAGGVEENVNIVVRNIGRHLGDPIASRLFGFTIWGDLGHVPTTTTVGF